MVPSCIRMMQNRYFGAIIIAQGCVMSNRSRFLRNQRLRDFRLKHVYIALEKELWMIDFVRVGKKIQEERLRMGMSQDVLSEALSVTRQALSRWENGLSAPSIDSLITLSRIFGVSIEELLLLDESPEIDPGNIFTGHDRDYILGEIIEGRLRVELEDVFYQFSPSERMRILIAIREGRLRYPVTEDLMSVLTRGERRFMNGGNEHV